MTLRRNHDGGARNGRAHYSGMKTIATCKVSRVYFICLEFSQASGLHWPIFYGVKWTELNNTPF